VVGEAVGSFVGASLGDSLRLSLGECEGVDVVDEAVGDFVGEPVGDMVGEEVGREDGATVGDKVATVGEGVALLVELLGRGNCADDGHSPQYLIFTSPIAFQSGFPASSINMIQSPAAIGPCGHSRAANVPGGDQG